MKQKYFSIEEYYKDYNLELKRLNFFKRWWRLNFSKKDIVKLIQVWQQMWGDYISQLPGEERKIAL